MLAPGVAKNPDRPGAMSCLVGLRQGSAPGRRMSDPHFSLFVSQSGCQRAGKRALGSTSASSASRYSGLPECFLDNSQRQALHIALERPAGDMSTNVPRCACPTSQGARTQGPVVQGEPGPCLCAPGPAFLHWKPFPICRPKSSVPMRAPPGPAFQPLPSCALLLPEVQRPEGETASHLSGCRIGGSSRCGDITGRATCTNHAVAIGR